jgi:hypothetical protein
MVFGFCYYLFFMGTSEKHLRQLVFNGLIFVYYFITANFHEPFQAATNISPLLGYVFGYAFGLI